MPYVLMITAVIMKQTRRTSERLKGRLRDRGNGEEEIFGGRVLIILCFSNRRGRGAQRPVYELLSLKIRDRSMAKTQLVEE